ncbi:MAG: lycopene cyclase domain-containing protein [Flavobacteriales bacterium]|nr:MAG: lycopene cyclase domain-containing protein [Flavobacteriales bacterium]
MSTYAWVNLLSVLFPLIFSFHPRTRFHREWKAAAVGIVAMMGLFIPWDMFFTANGVWRFNEQHVWDTKLLGLPLEEWGFFICIPYCCLFTYHCLNLQVKRDMLGPHARSISIALGALLIGIGLLNLDRAYTSTTLLLCAAFMLFVALVMKPLWLGRFYFAYLVLLIPFIIVNGILTGTGVAEEVVWYNGAENLGIRILTIPIEDTTYGLLMQLMAVTFFEMVRTRKASTA